MMFSLTLATSAIAFGPVVATAVCQSLQNDFWIDVQDLYAESAAWDPITCRLILSSAYNCSLVIFDPYTNSSDVVPIPGLTNYGDFSETEYHLAGVDFDPYTEQMIISAASASAFDSTGAGSDYSHPNYTGTNRLLKFDTTSRIFTADVDLASAQQAFLNKTGNRTSGFQDEAETPDGSVYVIGTFGNSIVKICPGINKPELWYVPDTYVGEYGFGGLFALGYQLVVSDKISGGLVTFDTRVPDPSPTQVKLRDFHTDYKPLTSDGLFAPSKYCGTIALWSDDFNGTAVYGSHDGWQSAQFLGLVLNDSPSAAGGYAVATFDIGEHIFVLTEFFQFELPEQPKTNFPIFDIPAQVDELVQENGFGQVDEARCEARHHKQCHQ